MAPDHSQTISDLLQAVPCYEKTFSKKRCQHLTKRLCFSLFIGPPDGEVFLYHLTIHLTRALTIHCHSTLPLR